MRYQCGTNRFSIFHFIVGNQCSAASADDISFVPVEKCEMTQMTAETYESDNKQVYWWYFHCFFSHAPWK